MIDSSDRIFSKPEKELKRNQILEQGEAKKNQLLAESLEKENLAKLEEATKRIREKLEKDLLESQALEMADLKKQLENQKEKINEFRKQTVDERNSSFKISRKFEKEGEYSFWN